MILAAVGEMCSRPHGANLNQAWTACSSEQRRARCRTHNYTFEWSVDEVVLCKGSGDEGTGCALC